MQDKPDRIRWSPRVQPGPIHRLYEVDALGIQDDDLCSQVGYKLYLRCRTILMVSRDEVECPRCGRLLVFETSAREPGAKCPTAGCGWEVTRQEYHQSWSKKRVWGANALPVFEEFYARYSPTLDYKGKMVLIDRLIHSFHWSLKDNLPNRSAANNLIEGSHDQVVAFLDRLTGIDPDRKAAWRRTMEEMMRRRKGRSA